MEHKNRCHWREKRLDKGELLTGVRSEVYAFFSAVIIGFIAHGYIYFNNITLHDNIYNFYMGGTYTLGRWMLAKLLRLSQVIYHTNWLHYSTPWYLGFVSSIWIGMSAALIVYALQIKSRLLGVLTGGILISFPVITSLFGYMFTSGMYSFGTFMGIAGVILFAKKEANVWKKLVSALMGILLQACSIGVYQANVGVIASFTMEENGSIGTLSSLQNVKALDLDLGWNDRVDYSVLADMTNLSSLKLKSEYGGLDFEILSNLGLTSLDLTQYNSSVELGQLASIFPGLITLKIRAYEIKQDVSALSALTNLKELEVWCVDDFDFESLAGLTGLETFTLMNYQNYMEESLELSPLEALPNLTALDLTGSQLPVDTSQLSGLTNLKMLKLRACGITDISGLSSLTNLETLDLSVNNFTDVSSLSGLTNLTTLNLKGNEIADYSPVSFVPEVLIGWDDYIG